MNRTIIGFTTKTIIILTITFVIHLICLNFFDQPLYSNKIEFAYIINALLAILIFSTLYSFRNTFKTQIGFLFIGGSVVKMICFFLFFNSSYKADNIITRPEFFAFFTPYLVTLILEVFYISKWLNKMK